MAAVSTYLNFPGNTEEAFLFYRSVFGGEFVGGIRRMGEVPAQPGQPPMSESDKKLVLHVTLPILGGHQLMATDASDSMGAAYKLTAGNNVHLNLEPDTRAETDRLYAALGAGGKQEQPPQEMFWGAYWGTLTDRFGIHWMFNCAAK